MRGIPEKAKHDGRKTACRDSRHFGADGSGGRYVCTTHIGHIARRIHDAVLDVVPSIELTLVELVGVRSLINHAVADSRFFDWEMPTLTGFSADGFRQIAEKVPNP